MPVKKRENKKMERLKIKWNFMDPQPLQTQCLKNYIPGKLNVDRLHHKQACYRLSYRRQQRKRLFRKTYKQRRTSKIKLCVYSKETTKCRHLIFWPGSQRRVFCHTTKSDSNNQPGPLASDSIRSHI
jgi:hypothetical protein